MVDTFTGNSDQTPFGGAPSTESGFGPNTRTLMQLQVVDRTGAADPAAMNLLETLAANGAATIGNLVDSLLPKLEKLEARKAVLLRDLT